MIQLLSPYRVNYVVVGVPAVLDLHQCTLVPLLHTFAPIVDHHYFNLLKILFLKLLPLGVVLSKT